jgi:hypothetical protein
MMSSLDYELFADDILTIDFDQNSMPGAAPYLRRLKLRGDSITELALASAATASERLDKEKYFVQPKCAADDRWCRLDRLYLLEIDPISSRKSIDRALIDQTYHFDFVVGTRRFNDHLTFCTQLASKIAIYRLRRSPLVGAGKSLRP